MDYVCFQTSFCSATVTPQLRSEFTQTKPRSSAAQFPVTARRRRVRPPLQSSAKTVDPSSQRDAERSGVPLSEEQSHIPTTRSSNWMFFDVARVLVKGGTGGDGCLAFLRQKEKARGGPSGGNGGRGGSVVFIAERGSNTLANFRGGTAFRASDGTNGSGKSCMGEGADDIVVSVPVGTIVRTEGADAVLADLDIPGARFVAARGGRGGRGNAAFKTARNTAPRMSEPGEPGVERWLSLELKLVADVALVGIPNAGKSTFLRAISNATPKVADYPFTTVVPNLGVVDGEVGAGLVVADVPGLVEGAHRGVGMGVAFLRHVERCLVVLHLVDGSATDEEVLARYRAIRTEMELFNPSLGRKKEVVLVNKADLPGVRERWEGGLRDKLVEEIGTHRRVALVSAMRKEGVRDVLRRLELLVASAEGSEPTVVVLGDEEERLRGPDVLVSRDYAGGLVVGGWKVERAYRMTNWNLVESIDRFQRILSAIGVNALLKEKGAKDGDTVSCFDREFVYSAIDNVYSAAAMEDGYID